MTLDRTKKRGEKICIGSILLGIDPEGLDSRKEAGREAQGAQSSSEKNCRENVSPLSRLIIGFRDKYD